MPSGFYNGSIMFADNVRFDGLEQPGQVTADGQLIIGSGVAPHLRVATLSSSDASIDINNGNGTIDLKISAYSMIRFKSGVIDLTATGDTILFTIPERFIVTDIYAYGDLLTGTIGNPIANFGWTAALYDDIIDGYQNFSTVTNNLNGINIVSTIGESPTIPAGTSVRINVTTADGSATTNNQIIYMTGFYI
jgi:hypothetical protein